MCRLAFADTRYYVGDPAFTDVPVEGMLDPEYGRARAQLIDPAKASVDVLRGPMHWIASVSLSGRLLVLRTVALLLSCLLLCQELA